MTHPGAPRIAMQPGYQPSVHVLRQWRRGQSYMTALGYLMGRIEVDDNGCWVWRFSKNHHGYGVVTHWQWGSGLAHRFAWWIFNGSVPAGLTLDHLCRVRACVNPGHLEPVTMGENLRRSPLVVPTHCKHGHAYTPENTIRRKTGWRECRACANARRRVAA